MLRRDFLKTGVGFLTGLVASPLVALESPTFVHPIFGKYVKHTIRDSGRGELYEMPQKGPYFRFISFPIEVVLTIQFEKYEVVWTNFNCSESLQKKIVDMAPESLLADYRYFYDGEDCNIPGTETLHYYDSEKKTTSKFKLYSIFKVM